MANAKICLIKRCPEPTQVRIRDKANTRRVDVCLTHALVAIHHYGGEVEIVDTWNGITSDDVMSGAQKLKELRDE